MVVWNFKLSLPYDYALVSKEYKVRITLWDQKMGELPSLRTGPYVPHPTNLKLSAGMQCNLVLHDTLVLKDGLLTGIKRTPVT